MIGTSSIGQKIVDHLPDSWNWKIQLWTLGDCAVYCKDELAPYGQFTIKSIEPIMIRKFNPVLNVIYNLHPGTDSMPKSEQEKRRDAELDRAYYEIFEKKIKLSRKK